MRGSVNNGQRIEVRLADYEGPAGFVEKPDGTAQLAYQPSRTARVRRLDVVEVDGRSWQVTAVENSAYVRGFRVLTLVKAS